MHQMNGRIREIGKWVLDVKKGQDMRIRIIMLQHSQISIQPQLQRIQVIIVEGVGQDQGADKDKNIKDIGNWVIMIIMT